MSTLQRIVAATDFSAPARHAAERAALVSKATGASLELLHVANLDLLQQLRQLLIESDADLQQRLLDVARERLRDLSAKLSGRYGVTARIDVVAGSVVAAISGQADAESPGLIVCGARGESVIRQLLLGSTAERLLSRASCPVLVVKQTPRDEYRKLLCAVDFSPASMRAISHAQLVAPRADTVVLHAFEVPFEAQMRYASVNDQTLDHYRGVAQQNAMQKLQTFGEGAGLPARAATLQVLHGHPVTRILEQEQEQDCDLIVMGRRGQSAFEELLLGSVTKRVLTESQSDVLIST